MLLIVVAPSDSHLKPWIPILENFVQYLTRPAVLANGIVCQVLVILLLLLQSKVILRLYLRNNCVLTSSPSKQSRFFYQSSYFWQGYGIEKWRIWQSALPLSLFWLEIKHSLKLYSSARIEVLIWDV